MQRQEAGAAVQLRGLGSTGEEGFQGGGKEWDTVEQPDKDGAVTVFAERRDQRGNSLKGLREWE